MNIDNPFSRDIPNLKTLWKEAFGDTDDAIDSFFDTAFSAERCMCVKSGDNIAAALYWFECMCMDRPVAYIYAVATAKAYRGKGICHKLMGYTHEHLKGLGYDSAVLVPESDSLFQFYSKMGYSVCNSISEICSTASENAAEIRIIDNYEYAKLRRIFLPKCGVVQEKENLDYLLTQAELYAGVNFLLASRKDGEKLYGIELLGDNSAAPDILCALKCSKGTFRIPGEDRAFAMCLPLSDNKTMPEYFGLAFDR